MKLLTSTLQINPSLNPSQFYVKIKNPTEWFDGDELVITFDTYGMYFSKPHIDTYKSYTLRRSGSVLSVDVTDHSNEIRVGTYQLTQEDEDNVVAEYQFKHDD